LVTKLLRGLCVETKNVEPNNQNQEKR
jgi:hypothetical protein